MTKQQYLLSIANECMEELDAINIAYAKGIVFSINTRAKSRWGQCKRNGNNYSINIADVLVDKEHEQALKETVMHELLHSAPNGMTHKGDWKKYAHKVNNYYGYNITRCSTAEDKGVVLEERKIEYKYIARCKCCGQEVKRQKKSQFIAHMDNYKCGRCNGKFELIKG